MNIYTDPRTGIKYADYTLNGKRKRQSLRTKNQEVAIIKAAELVQDSNISVGVSVVWRDFLAKYRNYIKANKKPATVVIIENALSKLEAFKKPVHLSDVSPALLEDLKTHLKNINKTKYVAGINRSIRAIKTMMRQGELWDLIPPQKWAKVKKFKEPKGRVEFHTPQEISEILAHCSSEQWKVVVLLGSRAGLRRSEIAFLHWEDVDFTNNQLYIAPYKTEQHRYVPMSSDLRKKLLKIQQSKGFVVCVGDVKTRESASYVSAAYSKWTSVFSFRCFMHKLRHTFASHLVQSGVDLYRVSKLLGHSSIKMTEIYAHLAPIDLQQSIKRLPKIPCDSKKAGKK